jgi:hypothetical protein
MHSSQRLLSLFIQGPFTGADFLAALQADAAAATNDIMSEAALMANLWPPVRPQDNTEESGNPKDNPPTSPTGPWTARQAVLESHLGRAWSAWATTMGLPDGITKEVAVLQRHAAHWDTLPWGQAWTEYQHQMRAAFYVKPTWDRP